MRAFLGLTWDHPRGYRALEEHARVWRSQGGVEVVWHRQPLEGFESHPLKELCARYDLLVIDHPHVGEAAAQGCLVPAENWYGQERLHALGDATIGPVLRSYRYAGRHWALPLDAAAQVAVCRPDLLGDEAWPGTWDEVCRLAERYSVALPLAGPHALLSFFSVCVAHGAEPFADGALVRRDAGERALELMTALVQRSPPAAVGLNPIAFLDRMSQDDDIAYCPLVFGYVTYATSAAWERRALRFGNAPLVAGVGRPGSTLGGTGLAFSGRTRRTEGLVAYAASLFEERTQRELFPEFDAQPSFWAAWLDAGVNRRHRKFFKRTAATVERAWVRPRYPGYLRFQERGSALLRRGLLERRAPAALLQELEEAYATGGPGGHEL